MGLGVTTDPWVYLQKLRGKARDLFPTGGLTLTLTGPQPKARPTVGTAVRLGVRDRNASVRASGRLDTSQNAPGADHPRDTDPRRTSLVRSGAPGTVIRS